MRNTRSTRDNLSPPRAVLVEEIARELGTARAALRRRAMQELLSQDISLAHLHLLAILRAEGPLTVGALAGTLGISVASATGIVTRMETRGLVARARDEADRRVVTVHVAPGGTEALTRLEGRSREHLHHLLERMSNAELGQLRGGLSALGRVRDEAIAEEEHQG